MKARFNPTGLSIKLFTQDKEKDILECRIVGYENPWLTLHVQDVVSENRGLETPGFHIKGRPDVGYDKMTDIEVYIDRNIHHKIFEEYDDEFDGGFFITRSPMDRIDITYWDPKVHESMKQAYKKKNNLI